MKIQFYKIFGIGRINISKIMSLYAWSVEVSIVEEIVLQFISIKEIFKSNTSFFRKISSIISMDLRYADDARLLGEG